MANSTPNPNAGNEFIKSMNKSMKRKRITLIALLCALVVLIILIIVVGMRVRQHNRIEQAKSVIAQLDIETTFKTPEFADGDDWDSDGVANSAETAAGTGIQSVDTDGDGLSDGDEVALGTDPLKEDTDSDTLLDGYEVMAGLNPRVSSTDGSTPDKSREVEVTKTAGDCSLKLKGDANVAGASVEQLDLFGISSNASVVSSAYDFYNDHTFASAEITIKVDDERMSRGGYSYDDLKVLKFNSDSKEYTPMESKTDPSGHTVTASISESGTYVVGAEKTVNDPAVTRVCFLIDNSGSMYPKELCPTSSENDVDFKRLDFTKSLINKFDQSYEIALCKFTGTYTKMMDFTTERKELLTTLESIRDLEEIFDGTFNQTALRKCIDEFSTGGDVKYRNIIVMLSDGESDESDPDSVEKLVKLADEKSVIVLTVGLGRDIDRAWLQDIAYGTGGKYYSASDATALDDVYHQIVTTLNYDIVTYSSSDDKITGYSLYNTGFEPMRNGFSFKNFRTTTTSSVDFGMAVMARDWYMGSFPLSLGDIEPRDDSALKVSAAGYDLNGTATGSAYDSRNVLSAVSAGIFKHKYANVSKYLDYTSSGDELKVDKDYRFDSENKGWKIAKTKIEAGNLSWDYVELLNLDIAGGIDKIAKGYSQDDAQLVACLYRLNALQWDDSADEFTLTGGDQGFHELEDQLSKGVPVVTTIDDTHTVNTIGLIRDSSCHRKYILQIYDNNYPGKVKELYLEKKPVAITEINGDTATAKGDTFAYVATYEGKQVGLSFSKVEAR